MTEIRPITAGEAETFLETLCTCFDLDINRARGAFFTEPAFDLSKKWAAFCRGRMASILTQTSLRFGDFKAVGIAGVATDPDFRGEGIAAQLIETSLAGAKATRGEIGALLFARQTDLYERIGFDVVDHVVSGPIECSGQPPIDSILGDDEIRSMYSKWSDADPTRLSRDDLRWRVWNWSMRSCESFANGYICHEITQVREAVLPGYHSNCAWPVSPGTEWYGLRHTTELLEVPAVLAPVDLMLMAKNVPFKPVMFMTDQF